MKGHIVDDIDKIIELVFTLIFVGVIIYILFIVLIPGTCRVLTGNGAPNNGLCSVYPTTTSSPVATSTSTSTTSSTSTSTSVATTTIVYKGTCNPYAGFICLNSSLSKTNKLTIT